MATADIASSEVNSDVSTLEVPLKLSSFLQSLLSYLAGTLEEVVGVEDAAGFIALVGQQMGNEINQIYQEAMGDRLVPPEVVAKILVDLKNRIEGQFFIVEQDADRIVLGNHRCPLGSGVVGHPSLCMMTSNVFGVITAHHLGYAKVCIEGAIANGDQGCRVVVYTRPSAAAQAAMGREYYKLEQSKDD
ncbi:methanogen output domain 1-containing protein [Parathermosynechococcus lividus]